MESLDEMTSLAEEASLRSAILQNRKSLDPPLTREYIRDRIDIDDPLRGFQIRHKYGGWLQGFVLSTTFTTWTKYFEWNSKHSQSGMSISNRRHFHSSEEGWDITGDLAQELESQSRSGDPLGTGVVWNNVAEISLVGGLGCGEYLLRIALEAILKQKNYDFVVLQATPSSFSFYQKFGFVRVGAVAKYGTSPRVVGYRHWTYANEANLTYHGGPSCMMAKRLKGGFEFANNFSFMKLLNDSVTMKKPLVMPQVFQNITVPLAYPYSIVPGHFTPNSGIITPVTRKRKRTEKIGGSKVKVKSKRVNAVCTEKRCATPSLIHSDEERVCFEKRDDESKTASLKGLNLSTGRISKCDISLNSQKNDSMENEKDSSSPSQKNVFNGSRVTCVRKQRVTELYQEPSIQVFFNKVIAKEDEKHNKESYFFVVHYAGKNAKHMKVIKLNPVGTFAGRRSGRIKYKSAPDVEMMSVSTNGWETIDADMVSKTSIISNESWDIKDKEVEN